MNTTETPILNRRKAMLISESKQRSKSTSKQATLRKLIRPNIKDIYFFGRTCSKEDIGRYVWR